MSIFTWRDFSCYTDITWTDKFPWYKAKLDTKYFYNSPKRNGSVINEKNLYFKHKFILCLKP